LAVAVLGIRNGAQLVVRLESLAAPKALLVRGVRWGPYRTYASLYLWRIADSTIKPRTPAGSAPAKRSQD
jgi:DNA-3-methyladenine glycosylase II